MSNEALPVFQACKELNPEEPNVDLFIRSTERNLAGNNDDSKKGDSSNT